jgi:shikimate kinase
MIVLVGFMGAGKTTVGTMLSARLGLPFADSDQVLEDRAGRPIRQIFAEDGESAFRALEYEVIAGLLEGPPMVLALGGGAPGHPPTRELLTRGGDPPEPLASGGDPPPETPQTPLDVVYLHVGYAQALRRVGGDAGRPLLARPDLPAVYQRRQPVYAAIATLTVRTDGLPPETVSDHILARLAGVRAYLQ